MEIDSDDISDDVSMKSAVSEIEVHHTRYADKPATKRISKQTSSPQTEPLPLINSLIGFTE
jgi:hypothetical protein